MAYLEATTVSSDANRSYPTAPCVPRSGSLLFARESNLILLRVPQSRKHACIPRGCGDFISSRRVLKCV